MRSLRPAAGNRFRFCLVGTLLFGASGCGTGAPTETDPANAKLDVVQVTTLTTVQASSGLFLSPSPQQDVPSYVALGEPSTPVKPLDGFDRAKVDLALLFQSLAAGALPALEAELRPTSAGEWSPIEHYFPAVEPTDDGARWPLELFRAGAIDAAGISTEWSGWQAYGGLGVRQPMVEANASAAVATLDFEVRGTPSPLVLTLTDTEQLLVTNQSGQAIDRALLIYSHAGGVAVTALSALGPGASSITTLGPKEHPPEQLLELARGALADFFAASVGAELGAAMADAKSIPFLETHGFRLISMLDENQAPAAVEFSQPIGTTKRVVVSHSEILKPEEEARLLTVVADGTLDAAGVIGDLGRFSEGKLEFAVNSEDATVSTRATTLLDQLRGR
jgi:hypothetical protein